MVTNLSVKFVRSLSFLLLAFIYVGASEGAGAGGVGRSYSHRCTNYQQQALYRQHWYGTRLSVWFIFNISTNV